METTGLVVLATSRTWLTYFYFLSFFHFSKTLVKTGRIVIGRQFIFVNGQSFLWTGTISPSFQLEGTFPLSKRKFTKQLKGWHRISADYLAARAGIWSCPVALFVLIFFIILFTSAGLVFVEVKERDWWAFIFWYHFGGNWLRSGCWELEKYSARTSATFFCSLMTPASSFKTIRSLRTDCFFLDEIYGLIVSQNFFWSGCLSFQILEKWSLTLFLVMLTALFLSWRYFASLQAFWTC